MHGLPGAGEVTQARESLPEDLGSRRTVAFAGEVASKACHHEDKLSERGFRRVALRGLTALAAGDGTGGFPFPFGKDRAAGLLRAHPAQVRQIEDAPCGD